MKTKVVLLVFLLIFSSITNFAYAHKPLDSDGTNTTFENSLKIPDHKISWVIYEELSEHQAKFYSFEAKEGDSFYASIVIPKIDRLENYQPKLALAGEEILVVNPHDIEADLPPGGIVVFNYKGDIPSQEFYEPFGQATYWERQEAKISIPQDGTYYIVVFDSQGFSGKYSLAVGTIEDFSGADIVTILPSAWFETKLFFEDYVTLGILFFLIGTIPLLVVVRKKKILLQLR